MKVVVIPPVVRSKSSRLLLLPDTRLSLGREEG